MNGQHPDRDDLVAFALGALELEEERAVEAHVLSCARCMRELEALVPAVGVLGESVEQLEPPPELRERVLAEVRADVERSPAEREAAAPRRRRGGWRGILARPALAVGLAIVVAAVGGYLIAGNDGGGGPEQTTVPVVAQQGIGGTLAVGENTSMLDLHGLSQLKGDEVYQVWVGKGQSVRPSSNFIPDANGRAMTAVDGHLASGTRVMVTREPHPGRTTPTPPVLLSATVE
ncbi:MAG TPA: anti-sigma factor [Solirubrobacterales bacterium]|nr:anti-sigma factor [Solirubrobacterales bacterium]